MRLPTTASVIVAAVALGCVGCEETPESYVSELHFDEPAVSVRREGEVSFAVTVTNEGDVEVDNVPIDVTCNITYGDSTTPESQTLGTGPIAPGEQAVAKGRFGPYDKRFFSAPNCTYSVARVELTR